MKSSLIISLTIMIIACISVTLFISDVHTETVLDNKSENIKQNVEKQGDHTALANSSMTKSELTLAILFLGGVGLAVFRRNSFL